jgi:hypothetical protein
LAVHKTIFNPNGIGSIQPSVAAQRLRWVNTPTFSNPERVASIPNWRAIVASVFDSTLSGLMVFRER